jgi:hypothetical protein
MTLPRTMDAHRDGHTPGQWDAILRDDPRGQPQGAYRGLICILQCGPEGNIAVVSDGRTTTPKEWEANAILIAASPDLLEQLRRVDHTLTAHGKVDADTDLHAALRAAIAKASP